MDLLRLIKEGGGMRTYGEHRFRVRTCPSSERRMSLRHENLFSFRLVPKELKRRIQRINTD